MGGSRHFAGRRLTGGGSATGSALASVGWSQTAAQPGTQIYINIWIEYR